MSEIDYAARVAKGAALLDEKRPGWERLLNLETLEISSGSACITAQLSGVQDFRTGMTQLDLTEGNTGTYIAHGFNAEGGCDCCHTPAQRAGLPEGYDQDEAFDTLNALWKDLIGERLATQPAG